MFSQCIRRKNLILCVARDDSRLKAEILHPFFPPEQTHRRSSNAVCSLALQMQKPTIKTIGFQGGFLLQGLRKLGVKLICGIASSISGLHVSTLCILC